MDIFEGTGQEHSNSDNLKGTDNNQPKKNKPIKVINETEKKAIDQAFEEMLEVAQIKQESDIQFVRRAYKMAYEGHASMRRKSGEPYIFHPITVARIATEEIGLDATSVACALLHDVVEDTDISLKDLEGNFNSSVAHIVDGLTKIKGSFEDKGWVEKQAASVRKVLLTLGDDIRVILIKIADRLHNMRTLDSMPQHKRVRIASETLYLYAPIAHRLGLYKIKSELEDLCMKHTQYKLYKEIAKKLEEKKIEREAYISTFIEPVSKALRNAGFENFRIFGRPKHIYSIYNKIRTKKVAFDEIFDLFAIRIILDVPEAIEKAECWRAYAVVVEKFQPKPDRLRDWISRPKGNGYESLHTTVFVPEVGRKNRWVEVQIRSERMDAVAERGIAAHWRYKGHKSQGSIDEWLGRIRDFLQHKEHNDVEFVAEFTSHLYESDIFVFTPRGDVKNMPAGVSVLDFAFDIHTDIGCHCIGAKIDGKLQPIHHKLSSGDQVEILTSKKQHPTHEWLNHTITSKARTKIKSFLKNAKKPLAEQGKEMLERKLRGLKVKLSQNLLNELVKHFKAKDQIEFLYAIGAEEFDLSQLKDLEIQSDKIVIVKEKKPEPIEPEKLKQPETDYATADLSIFGGFADKVAYSIANCCRPVPGDDVFGFITIGKGIRIHRSDCPNAPDLRKKYGYRIVSTKWMKRSNDVLFMANLKIEGMDDIGLVHKLTSIVSNELKINIRNISFDAIDGIFYGEMNVFVKNNKELKALIKKLSSVQGIYKVTRLG